MSDDDTIIIGQQPNLQAPQPQSKWKRFCAWLKSFFSK